MIEAMIGEHDDVAHNWGIVPAYSVTPIIPEWRSAG